MNSNLLEVDSEESINTKDIKFASDSEIESDSDEESVEEVVVKRKHKPKEKNEPSYSQLADMSVEQQIKNKLQQEKITCFFNQLTGKKY